MDNIGIKSILLFTGLALSCDLMSQIKAGFPDEDVEAIVNPPLEENAAHILKFDSIVCHLGTLTEDDSPKTVRFSFTNVSDKPVLIDRVRTTCGCVSAGVEARRIPSGEKGSVTLKYVPKNHPGTIDTNAFVYVEGMQIVVTLGLSKVEELIKQSMVKTAISPFVRLGRSYIINQNYLTHINVVRQRLTLSDCMEHTHVLEIPKALLRSYKDLIKEKFTVK